jgi:hypothetical protein
MVVQVVKWKSEKVPMFQVPKDDTLFIKWKKLLNEADLTRRFPRMIIFAQNIS